jgi:plastocyanin
MTHRAKFLAVPVLLALAGWAVSAGPAASAASGSHLVTLKNIKFEPGVLHIARGDSVTWKWEDADIDTQHNVTSEGSKHFKSSTTKMRGTYTVKFTAAGTYNFECTIHPASMQGKIIVK